MNTLQRTYRLMFFWAISAWILCFLDHCAKPDTKKIDVDEIQGRVDVLESRLERMQIALKEGELERAQQMYEEITEGMKENREQLSAYPEYSLLKDRVQEASIDLCYEHVNVNLERFYHTLRAKDPDKARDILSTCQKEFRRCRSQIQSRSDFIALRMNLEGAPKAIEELEKKMVKEARLEKIQILQEQLSSKMDRVREVLARCEKQPEQKDLLGEMEEEIREIRSKIDSVKEYENEPVWRSFAVSTKKQLELLDKRRLTCQRKGELQRVARSLLPEADALVVEAAKAEDPPKALKLMKEAQDTYLRCEQAVSQVLRAEPRLARFSVVYKGKKKKAIRLVRFCKL